LVDHRYSIYNNFRSMVCCVSTSSIVYIKIDYFGISL
jgi:hypothetical protein